MLLAALAAGWIASGAAGLLGHPLRHTLTYLAGAVIVLAGRPAASRSPQAWLILGGGIVAAVAMNASGLISVNVLAVAVLLAVVAENLSGAERQAALVAALALASLGVYRLALKVGAFWTFTDRIGGILGQLAGGISGQPLWVGATFGGLDFLVVMGVFCVGWMLWGGCPRGSQRITVIAAIVVGHMVYLIILSFGPAIKEALAETATKAAATPPPLPYDVEKGWTLAGLIRNFIPWNLPALGVLIHLTIAGSILRWLPWSPEEPRSKPETISTPPSFRPAIWAGCAVLAASLAVATTLSPGSCSLKGKKIVANEEGFLNWLKPEQGQYGRLAIGMYGMAKEYFESMGAEFIRSKELSDADLAGADLLLMIYPNDPWKEGQLERIREYVKNGGALLILGEHTTKSKGEKDSEGKITYGESRVNEVLADTSMRVRFDSATFTVGGWLQSYHTSAHPTTARIDDERNRFGSVIGASMETNFPAVPLLVGRWGWADPGEMGGSAMMGNHLYDPGEKLGDLILASEQPYGKGRIIAFGDTSSFTNGITIGSHLYTSRLYGYLAGRVSSPQVLWRQLLGILLALGLPCFLVWQHKPLQIALAAVTLSGVLVICTRATYRTSEVLPDGRLKTPNNLAYMDSTHMEAYSPESWRPEGMMGMNQTLMRNGYLTLNLPEFTRRRIERAGLIVSVAPAREFSASERNIVRQFVQDGGIFICTVGYEQRGPSSSLLADFGFRIGLESAGPKDPEPEPQPMGHFKVPYVQSKQGRRQAYVRYHSSWPIAYRGEQDESPWNVDGEGRIIELVAHSGKQHESPWNVDNKGRIVDNKGRILDGKIQIVIVNGQILYKQALPLDDHGRTLDYKGRIVDENARTIAYGRQMSGKDLPCIMFRRFGKGKFVVIGDTSFAMNKNLERKDGRPIEGKRENADFWRWFLCVLKNENEPPWSPLPTTAPATQPAGRKEASK
jgi:hypothetical protein